MSFVFSVDRASSKRGSVLLSRGEKHFRIDGLSEELCDSLLIAARSDGYFDFALLPDPITAKLADAQFIVPEFSLPQPRQRFSIRNVLDSGFRALAQKLSFLGSWTGQFVMLVGAAIAFCSFSSPPSFTPLVDLIGTTHISSVVAAMALVAFSVVFHELGHATAVSYYAGPVGRMRGRFIWGMPAVTVDVTVQCLATKRGRAAIAVAGAVFQLFFSAVALALFSSLEMRIGASVGLVLAITCLIPLPGQDGYWLISDLLGKDLRPRFMGTQSRLDIGYGIVLTAAFIPGSISALMFSYGQVLKALEYSERNTVAFCAHILVAVCVVSTTIFFGKSLVQSLLFSGNSEASQLKV